MATNSSALTTTHGERQIQTAQLSELSVQAIVDRKRKIVEVMNAVMIEGVHYGKIPGCGDKPTLYKAGAEVLATVFGLAPSFRIEERELPNGHREYRITCTLTHIASGKGLGEGVGICTTMEAKYRWRGGSRSCPACDKTGTIIKGKAEYGGGWLCFAKKGGCGAKFADKDPAIVDQSVDRVENPDVADTYNTVLKMAKKRAQVDCTLTAVGASDILSQDLEDLPQGSRPDNRDVPDAEFVEHRDDPRDDRRDTRTTPTPDFDLDSIERTTTEANLVALASQIEPLPEKFKRVARERWRIHRANLRAGTRRAS